MLHHDLPSLLAPPLQRKPVRQRGRVLKVKQSTFGSWNRNKGNRSSTERMNKRECFIPTRGKKYQRGWSSIEANWGERGRRSRHYQSQEVQQARVTSIYIHTHTASSIGRSKRKQKKISPLLPERLPFFIQVQPKEGIRAKQKLFSLSSPTSINFCTFPFFF